MSATWKLRLIASAVILSTSVACTAQPSDDASANDAQRLDERDAEGDGTCTGSTGGLTQDDDDDRRGLGYRNVNAPIPQTRAEIEAAMNALEAAHRQLMIRVKEEAKVLLSKPYVDGQFYRDKVIMPMLEESDNLMRQHAKLGGRLSAMTCGRIVPRALARFAGFFRLCGTCAVGAIGEVLLNPGACQAAEPDFCDCETAQMDADNVGHSYINECAYYHERYGGDMSFPPKPGSYFFGQHRNEFNRYHEDCKDLADWWVRSAARRDEICLR